MFYSICNACKQKKLKWFIKKRRYLVPKVSPTPITSVGELCGKCYRNIKRVVIKQINGETK